MAEPICTCPASGFGYRFHRWPCRKAGEITPVPPRPRGYITDDDIFEGAGFKRPTTTQEDPR